MPTCHSPQCQMIRSVVLFALLLAPAIPSESVRGQGSRATADSAQSWYEGAWTHIVSRNGVHFAYVFYSEADNENNGVVLRLRNENDWAARYAFTIIFRTPDAEASAFAQGTLQPGQMKTGEGAGLFWIPFRDGRRIAEVGLRNIEVSPMDDS